MYNEQINDDDSIRFLMEAEIRSLREQQEISIDRQGILYNYIFYRQLDMMDQR